MKVYKGKKKGYKNVFVKEGKEMKSPINTYLLYSQSV